MPDSMTGLEPAQREALRSLSSCAVANAIERLGIRLRNEGLTDGFLRLLTPDHQPVLGFAVTVKIKCSSPPAIGARNYLERTQWWDQLQQVPAPRFLVIQDVDPAPGTGALVGEMHAHILRALGCSAVATNGSVRDLPEVAALGFSLFASRLSV